MLEVCHHYAMSSFRHWHFSPVNSKQIENQVRDCYGDVKEISTYSKQKRYRQHIVQEQLKIHLTQNISQWLKFAIKLYNIPVLI